MDRGKDARAEELHHLRLALATFALQLDAFEARTNGVGVAPDAAPSGASPQPEVLRESEGGN
jgi:hypothetical protein